ncbi:hypothetical protein SDC9_209649 [bioreactor metagenome]|uniref:Uncharacterized protein n=1 Tax=bioreactor metagenome TaxID=1076179 RepID=A0A645JQX3_9ZZZZ
MFKHGRNIEIKCTYFMPFLLKGCKVNPYHRNAKIVDRNKSIATFNGTQVIGKL